MHVQVLCLSEDGLSTVGAYGDDFDGYSEVGFDEG